MCLWYLVCLHILWNQGRDYSDNLQEGGEREKLLLMHLKCRLFSEKPWRRRVSPVRIRRYWATRTITCSSWCLRDAVCAAVLCCSDRNTISAYGSAVKSNTNRQTMTWSRYWTSALEQRRIRVVLKALYVFQSIVLSSWLVWSWLLNGAYLKTTSSGCETQWKTRLLHANDSKLTSNWWTMAENAGEARQLSSSRLTLLS